MWILQSPMIQIHASGDRWPACSESPINCFRYLSTIGSGCLQFGHGTMLPAPPGNSVIKCNCISSNQFVFLLIQICCQIV
ncbi:hypothetical protein PVAP13_4NG229588 [Panicum virgatum]|uniref:Uncharacterized protein n=1 Tax=Panicum virgatum TaxID=38727 RepID=A0A8T0TAM5_PANVG|nr:hypothetical protein PVAP13_4NG229588 [Panicum virgatum]